MRSRRRMCDEVGMIACVEVGGGGGVGESSSSKERGGTKVEGRDGANSGVQGSSRKSSRGTVFIPRLHSLRGLDSNLIRTTRTSRTAEIDGTTGLWHFYSFHQRELDGAHSTCSNATSRRPFDLLSSTKYQHTTPRVHSTASASASASPPVLVIKLIQ